MCDDSRVELRLLKTNNVGEWHLEVSLVGDEIGPKIAAPIVLYGAESRVLAAIPIRAFIIP